jgi:hypothetical protein
LWGEKSSQKTKKVLESWTFYFALKKDLPAHKENGIIVLLPMSGL